MERICRSVLFAVSIPVWLAYAQSGSQPHVIPANTLSITNYRFVSQQQISSTQYNVTYAADLINTGPAITAITATVTTQAGGVQVVQGNLHFSPVPANSQVSSNNTFTLLIDRTVTFSFTSLQWSFNSPVANAGPDQTASVGTTVTLNGSGSTNPSGIGSLSYNWTFVSRPPGTAAVLLFSNSVTPQFTVDVDGEYIIGLTVTNGAGHDTATVTVSTGNTPPVANAGPNQTVAVNSTVTLNGGGSSDVNGNPLTYSWTLQSVPIGSTATLTGANTVSPTFVADKPGTYVAQLIVNDGIADSTPALVMITTQHTPPVANAGSPQIVTVGATVQLDGSASTDSDGNPLTYQWSLISVPQNSTAKLNNPAIVNPTFVADLPGQYVAQLIVNDGFSNSAAATVMISTSPIQAPTANAGANQTVALGSLVTLHGSGTDIQGLPLTFQWSLIFKPSGSAATLSSTSVANPTFTVDVPGQYIAQLIVNNGFLNSQPSTVTISTSSNAPVANPGPNQNVAVGTLVTLNGSGSTDSDNQPLTYSWSLLTIPPQSSATLTGANTVSPSFVADAAGLYVVQLIVNDGVSNSIPATVTIIANGIKLTPNPLNLTTSAGTLTATLPMPAGTNGQVINLASSNTNVATVQPNITITGGQTTGSITVTPGNVGSTLILAAAPGYAPGSAQVNVGSPTLTVSLAFGSVGISRTENGQVTLSGPTPANLTVTLSANPQGIINLPSTITILAGSSSGSFTVTGVAQGATTITASALGYFSGETNVTVGLLGAISLPSGVTVNPGQSAPFPITLETGAPQGGVTINLASNDTTKVTISPSSVFIPALATSPSTQPQVTGVNFGSANIGATASGFMSTTQQVLVTGSITFSPNTLAVLDGTTQNLTLNLTGFAPPGLIINLSSDNTSVAKVPATINFPATASSASIPVTGAGSGTAHIHASSLPNLADTVATVTVAQFGPIGLPANVTLKVAQTVPFPITLPSAAPPGGTTVTLTSSDNTKATVTSSVFVAYGATTPATQPQVTGVAPGSPIITASAPGYTTSMETVQVTSSNAASITATSGGGQTAKIDVQFTNPLVATVKDASNNPVQGVTVTFTGPATGAGIVTATAVTNASGVASAAVTANATAGGPYTVSATVIGVTAPATFSLTNTPGPPASITATSGSGQTAAINKQFANALVATVKDAGGNPVPNVTVTFTGPATGASIATVAVVTNSSGAASATVTANGSAGGPYTVSAAVSGVGSPAIFSLTNSAGNASAVTVVAGNNQSVKVNTAFGAALQAKVTDGGGNPVPNVTVTFTVNPATNTAGGSFASGNTAVTNASGVATANTFTANGKAGSYTVTAAAPGATSATFNLTNTAGSAAAVTATAGNNQSAVINTAFATALQVTVTDSGGNPVPSVTVTFTVNPATSGASGAFTGGDTATTNASGVATANTFTANSKAGAYTVTATTSGATPAVFNLTNAITTPATVTATAGNNQSAQINTAFGTALKVTVTDSGGNPVPNVTVTFTPNTGASGAGGSFASGNTAVTNSSGVATANTLTANGKIGSFTVTASVSGASPATFSLTNTTGTPATVSATAGNNQSAKVSAVFGVALQATVLDSGGNPIPNVTVTFTVKAGGTGASATFSGGNTAVTNASGVATASTLTANSKVGSFTVTAAASGASSATFNLTNTAGNPATVTATAGNNQSAKINTAFATALQVTVTDSGGNPVSNATVTFTVTPATNGAGGSFSTANTAVTNASGVATANSFTANTKTGSYTVTAAVTGAPSATFSLTNTPGNAATVSATGGNNQSTGVTKAFAAALQATVTDAGGNPVPNVTVTFTVIPVNGAGASFASGNTAVTNASGVATASTLIANSTAGSYTVTAAASGAASATFNLSNTSGGAATVTATAGNNQSAKINTAFATALQVKVTDSGGNPVPNVTVTFAVSAGASGAAASFTGGNTAVSNASGVATANALTGNSKVGSFTVLASASGATSAVFNLTNTVGSPATVSATGGNNQSAKINTAFGVALQATVLDAGGNPVPNITVTFTVQTGATSAGATFSSGNTAVTNAAGVATASTLTANTKVGSFTVTGAVTGVSPATFSLMNTAGNPAEGTATAGNNQSTKIDTAFATALQATVTDAGGNPVPGVTVTFTVATGATGATASFTGASTATTNSSGVATASALTANGKVGLFTVTGLVSGASSATFNLTNTVGTPATVTASAGNNQSAKVGTAFATALHATVTDVGGNPVPNVTVTFALTAGASGASASFTTGNTAVTNASGIATANTLTANTKAGGFTVTASATGAGTSATFSLTNTPGNPATVTATAGNNQSAQIDKPFATALQATVTDSDGNPVPNTTVTFTVVAGSGASASFTGGNTATTNASGIATANTLTANSKVGMFSVTAAVSGVMTPATFSLTNTTGSPASVTATGGNNQSAKVNTAFAAPLQATVLDSGGNPVSNVIVTFSVNVTGNGAGGSFSSGNTAVTNASGVATSSTFTANGKAGGFTVTASATPATNGTFNLTNTPGPPTTVTATAGNSQSAQVTTAFATALQATVTDAGGNPVSGVTVTFRVTPGATGAGATFTGGGSSVSNAAGVAIANTLVANSTSGAFTVTAAATGTTSATFNLSNTHGPASKILASTGSGQSTVVSTVFPSPLVAIVQDANGNPISGITVTFAGPTSGAGIIDGTAVTNTSGAASATITANSTAGGPYLVNATVPGVTGSATFSLTNSPIGGGGSLTLTSTTVGRNLENTITVSVPTGGTACAPPNQSSVSITLSSPDAGTQLLLSGRAGSAGTNPLTICAPPGSPFQVYAQGLVASGQVTVTASGTGFTSGTGTVQFTPSGFIIAGPAGIGTATFTTNPGIQTPLSVYPAQLDSSLNFVQTLPLSGAVTATVNVTSSNTSAGTISSSPLTLTGGQASATTNFVGAGQGTSTISVSTTTTGFSIPTQDTSLIATVNPSGLVPETATVGNGLETTAFIALNGVSPLTGVSIQVTSSDPSKLLLSLTPTGPGLASVKVITPNGFSVTRTQNFYVYGLANSGTVSYTATDVSGTGFGSANGTITLAPSAVIVDAGNGPGVSVLTTTGAAPNTITVESALLDSSGDVVSTMALAGGTTATINVTESNVAPATGVGTVSPSPVTITGGNFSTTTEFTPLNAGTAIITAGEPAPFSTPNQTTSPFQMVDIQVSTPGFGITSGIAIGNNLEVQATLSLGVPAPASGVTVTISAPSGLLFAAADNTAGKSSIQIPIANGGTSATYIIQAQGSSGTASYTVSGPGYATRTGTITLTPSGPVMQGVDGAGEDLVSLAAGPTPVTVFMAQLNADNSYSGNIQALAPQAGPVSVGITSGTIATGTVQSPVTVTGGLASLNGVNTTFTPIAVGSTILSLVKPAGYTLTTTPGNTTLDVDVTP